MLSLSRKVGYQPMKIPPAFDSMITYSTNDQQINNHQSIIIVRVRNHRKLQTTACCPVATLNCSGTTSGCPFKSQGPVGASQQPT